jgi:hypothetical protein
MIETTMKVLTTYNHLPTILSVCHVNEHKATSPLAESSLTEIFHDKGTPTNQPHNAPLISFRA